MLLLVCVHDSVASCLFTDLNHLGCTSLRHLYHTRPVLKFLCLIVASLRVLYLYYAFILINVPFISYGTLEQLHLMSKLLHFNYLSVIITLDYHSKSSNPNYDVL